MYSHQKYVTISGHYGDDRSASLVFTGSSNFTHSGVSGDEMILRAHGRRLVKQWNTNFQNIWENWSRPADGPGGFHPSRRTARATSASARALTTRRPHVRRLALGGGLSRPPRGACVTPVAVGNFGACEGHSWGWCARWRWSGRCLGRPRPPPRHRPRQAEAPPTPWQPESGGFFNNPWGDRPAKFRIERQVIEAIRHAHKGSHIRIAVYSFDRLNVARALVDAHGAACTSRCCTTTTCSRPRWSC